ncbi:MAG: hypothetical protein R6U55_00010 [Desulfovermiculus sp.]
MIQKETCEQAGGANNHSPSSTWADTQLNTLKGPDYQASKVRPYAATPIVVKIVGAKLVFARQAPDWQDEEGSHTAKDA